MSRHTLLDLATRDRRPDSFLIRYAEAAPTYSQTHRAKACIGFYVTE
jgi:hypothetical protein